MVVCCCCCLHIKNRSDLYSVLSNIRTGPTDANAFLRGHSLTTQKGCTLCKNQKEIKGPRKVNTHAIIGKEKKNPQKNMAPDSQTSQATFQTKEIDRAHRSHSTRETKHNKTNKKSQGSPIKTIESHDSILVPPTRPGCIHRRVCTGQAMDIEILIRNSGTSPF